MSTNKPLEGVPKVFENTSDWLHCRIKAGGFFDLRFQGDSDEYVIHEQFNKREVENVPFRLNLIPHGKSISHGDRMQGSQNALGAQEDSVVLCRFQVTKILGGSEDRRNPEELRKMAKILLPAEAAFSANEMMFRKLTGERDTLHSSVFEPDDLDNHNRNNLLRPPASMNHLYAYDDQSKSSLTDNDKLSMKTIKNALRRINEIRQKYSEIEIMRPLRIGDFMFYALVVHPNQKRDLLRDIGDPNGLEMMRKLTGSKASEHPIAKRAKGLIDGDFGNIKGLILHEDSGVVTFKGGQNCKVDCAAGLLLGRQAGLIAYGFQNGSENEALSEESVDYGNKRSFAIEVFLGINKCQIRIGRDVFDCGVMRIDTAAKQPML